MTVACDQDYYNVKWTFPLPEINYSSWMGGGCGTGETWEPDECLPTTLGAWRAAAKKHWIVL